MDVTELDTLIEKRAVIGDDAAEREEGWKASTRAHNARRQEELRRAWAEYHRHIAAAFERRSQESRAKAERLEAS